MFGFKFFQKFENKFGNVENFVADTADIRKMQRDFLVVEFTPQSARCVQKVNAVYAQPLFAFCDAGTVARHGFCLLAHCVDNG